MLYSITTCMGRTYSLGMEHILWSKEQAAVGSSCTWQCCAEQVSGSWTRNIGKGVVICLEQRSCIAHIQHTWHTLPIATTLPAEGCDDGGLVNALPFLRLCSNSGSHDSGTLHSAWTPVRSPKAAAFAAQ